MRIWAAFAISAAVVLLWMLYLFPRANRSFRPAGGRDVVALQLSWTVDRFVETLDSWVAYAGTEAIDLVRRQIIRLDFVFPVAYAIFGVSALALLWGSGSVRYGLLLPVAAAGADWIENLLILYAMKDLPPVSASRIPSWAVPAASLSASVKFLLLITTVGLILVGLGWRLWMVIT